MPRIRDMERARTHVLIRGRVQGVGFRYSTLIEAQRLGLAGWVRNVGYDTVEAVFEGPRADLEDMIGWCHRGPPMARVESVDVAWAASEGETGFSFRSSTE